jgi:hypothetical protein
MKTARLSVNHQAEIRAERQALRLRFDLDMLGQMPASNGDEAEAAIADGVIEEDVVEVSAWDLPVGQDEAEVKIREDATADQSASKMPAHVKGMVAPILQELVDKHLAENVPAAAAIINGLGLIGKPSEQVIAKVRIYRGWRDVGKERTEAFSLTIADKIPQ